MPIKNIISKNKSKDRMLYDAARDQWVSIDGVNEPIDKAKSEVESKVPSPQEEIDAHKVNLTRATKDLQFLQDDYDVIFKKYNRASAKEREYNHLELAYKRSKQDVEALLLDVKKKDGELEELHNKTDLIVQRAISFEMDTAEFHSKMRSKDVFFKQLLSFFKQGARSLTPIETDRVVSIIRQGMELK